MVTRLPASQRTREELTALIEGRLSTASAKDEMIKLASRLIVEEALEGEARDLLGREYYAHRSVADIRIAARAFSLKVASQIFISRGGITAEPYLEVWCECAPD